MSDTLLPVYKTDRGSKETLLSKTTNDKQPELDLATHNHLKRSYDAHEKRKLQNARRLRSELKQCQAKAVNSIKSICSAESSEELLAGAEENWSSTSIPGFRYRANGDERKSLEDLRRLRLINSLTGLNVAPVKSAVAVETTQDDINVPPKVSVSRPATSHGASSENALTTLGRAFSPDNSTTYTDWRPVEPAPGRPQTTYGYYKRSLADPEEEANFRLRKVQEQLGLSGKFQSIPKGRAANEAAMSDAVQDLEHALKMLHLAFRSQQESESTVRFGTKSPCKKTDRFIPMKDSPSTGSSKEFSIIRNKCHACLMPYKEDISDLIKPSSGAMYRKPRWRLSPSGQYVSPPLRTLRICHPELFTYSRSGSVKSNTPNLTSETAPADQFFPHLVDLSLSSGGPHHASTSHAGSATGGSSVIGGPAPTTKTINRMYPSSAYSSRRSSAGLPPTGQTGELFEEMVKIIGSANRPGKGKAYRTLMADQEEAREMATVAMETRKMRNTASTKSLQHKVRHFLHKLPPPAPQPVRPPPAAEAAAEGEVAAPAESYPSDFFGESDYFEEPLT